MVLVAMGACLPNSSSHIDMASVCVSMCWHFVMQCIFVFLNQGLLRVLANHILRCLINVHFKGFWRIITIRKLWSTLMVLMVPHYKDSRATRSLDCLNKLLARCFWLHWSGFSQGLKTQSTLQGLRGKGFSTIFSRIAFARVFFSIKIFTTRFSAQ